MPAAAAGVVAVVRDAAFLAAVFFAGAAFFAADFFAGARSRRRRLLRRCRLRGGCRLGRRSGLGRGRRVGRWRRRRRRRLGRAPSWPAPPSSGAAFAGAAFVAAFAGAAFVAAAFAAGPRSWSASPSWWPLPSWPAAAFLAAAAFWPALPWRPRPSSRRGPGRRRSPSWPPGGGAVDGGGPSRARPSRRSSWWPPRAPGVGLLAGRLRRRARLGVGRRTRRAGLGRRRLRPGVEVAALRAAGRADAAATTVFAVGCCAVATAFRVVAGRPSPLDPPSSRRPRRRRDVFAVVAAALRGRGSSRRRWPRSGGPASTRLRSCPRTTRLGRRRFALACRTGTRVCPGQARATAPGLVAAGARGVCPLGHGVPHMQNGRAAGAPRTPEAGKNTERDRPSDNMPHRSPTGQAP